MNRQDLQSYVDRWQLVKQLEAEEMKNAPVELLIQQTLSIWGIARMLDFQHQPVPPDRMWQALQRKWLETNG